MSELSLRDAVAADIAAILALSDAGRPAGAAPVTSEASDPAYAAALNRIAADPNNRLIVMERGGEIIGTLQITLIPGLTRGGLTRGLLENVHVRPDCRGQGLGSALVGWAIGQCRAAGCGLIQLTSDKRRPDAHRFYGRLGFEPTHEGFKLVL